jgi:hypothetical protein
MEVKMRFLLTAAILFLTGAAGATADDIAVTVYNSNLGVISETRTLQFKEGVSRLEFSDVPSRIDPNSVTFEISDEGKNASLLEQNYSYDVVNPGKMYQKYVDKPIELISEDGQVYSGTLLSQQSGVLTLQQPTGEVNILPLEHIAEIKFPVLPEGLITRPTLFWLVRSDFTGEVPCQVGYQTAGLSWEAEYVGLLNSDETELELSGWSSIDNRSGKTYKDAQLKLIAGDIHRAKKARVPSATGRTMEMIAPSISAGFEEKEFFEYHMYTLPRKATVADNEKKQISLFDPGQTEVEKIYLYEPDKDADRVSVAVKFVNSEKAGLGMPLPAGRVRVFKADTDGSRILLGEDLIEHTPRNEEVKLTVGYAFDIIGEQTMANQTRISSSVEEQTWEIELRNRKTEPITVAVEKKLYGFWEILESNFEYKKKDANTVAWSVPVPADSTATVQMKVRFTHR